VWTEIVSCLKHLGAGKIRKAEIAAFSTKNEIKEANNTHKYGKADVASYDLEQCANMH
jgi:hypothetical protein